MLRRIARWLRSLVSEPTYPPCLRCDGSGAEPTLPEVACVRCDGEGAIHAPERSRIWLSREFLVRVALGEFRRNR